MFNNVHIKLTSDSQVSFSQATSGYLETFRQQATSAVSNIHEMYQGNKEMVDSFPFIQEFLDAVEKNGNGQLKIGIASTKVAVDLDLYGNDLGKIYRRIVG